MFPLKNLARKELRFLPITESIMLGFDDAVYWRIYESSSLNESKLKQYFCHYADDFFSQILLNKSHCI